MKILGVSFLPESSVTLVVDGKVVAALSEERLNRVKQAHGFPKMAIAKALEMGGLKIEDIDYVATHGLAPAEPDHVPYKEKEADILASDLPAERKQQQIENLRQRQAHETMVHSKRTPAFLEEIRALGRPLKTYSHHHCHAATAYYGSGWKECMVLTADGWGEDASSTIWKCAGGKLERVSRSNTFDSLGYFYGSITKALGFMPHRHEGKVLGLAAFCPEPKSYGTIRSMVDYDPKKKRFVGRIERGTYLPRFENPHLVELAKQHSREDMAASAQRSLEEVVCECARDLGPHVKLALAGGVFANVKLNQRLLALDNIDELYVFPNMGDGGLSTGAAWMAYAELTNKQPEPLPTLYLGPSNTEAEIEAALKANHLKFERCADIADRVAELLSKGEIVARFDGRMEFGPRSLGNRSILVEAKDPTVNDWLNKRLKRSEFMPFAPITLAERAKECYVNMEGAEMMARHMTITFDCTPKMREQSGAAVHVDGTARPQLVTKQENPQAHAILTAYHKRTGIPSVINTSFNMHEEPIVCSIEDAIRAYLDSDLPYMAAGNFLVSRESATV